MSSANIWLAAGDGDLPRVQLLVEHHAVSPNAPDPFTYTPMHAAASYGHIHVLDCLIRHGGDANVTDQDGDTPLYTVEDVETARFLVEHGAVVDRRNNANISPAEHLAEDFPHVVAYLQSLGPAAAPVATQPPPPPPLSQHQQEVASEQLTSALMSQVQDIMQRAEAEGRDPDEELRQVVGRTVLEGMLAGYGMRSDADQRDDRRSEHDDTGPKDHKRMRFDDSAS